MSLRNVGLAGSALLLIGLFVPIATMPMIGNMNLMTGGLGVPNLCFIFLAGLSGFLAFRERNDDLIWPGAAALLFAIFLLVRMQMAFSAAKANMAEQLKDNPFAGIAQAAMAGMGLQWGWLILFAGAACLIYVAIQARKEQGVGLFSIPDQGAKGIALASAAALLLVVGNDLINNDWNAAKSSTTASALDDSGESVLADAQSAKSDAEQAAYIRDHLKIYDFTAKIYDSMLDGEVPGVDFKIKNNGNRTITHLTVKVIFLDEHNKPIAEETFNPIAVGSITMGNEDKPLRPNYIWQNEADRFYSAKSVPNEWKPGNAQATITEIEFES